MRTTWEKIVNHVRKIYGHDISNESQNKKRIGIPQQEHTKQVKDKHLDTVERLRYKNSRLMQSREVKLKFLEVIVQIQEYPEALLKLAMLIHDIDEANYQETDGTDINIYDNEKTQ